MFQYKIEKLTFNDGTEITPGNLTIIVGPNNCGKSRILKDIKSLTSDQTANSIVVSDLEYSLPSSVDDLVESCEIKTFSDQNNNLFYELSHLTLLVSIMYMWEWTGRQTSKIY